MASPPCSVRPATSSPWRPAAATAPSPTGWPTCMAVGAAPTSPSRASHMALRRRRLTATFSSPLISCRLAASSKTAGKTAAQREAEKRNSHPDLAHILPRPGSSLVFRGIFWESEGHPGPDAHLLVCEVARKHTTDSASLEPESRAEKIMYNRFIRTCADRGGHGTCRVDPRCGTPCLLARRPHPRPRAGQPGAGHCCLLLEQ
mmetsp:Transcript_17293/g.55460  ORF Transcript_17293/g.55460 Transcript_17293/m.55460 type:complete len:203 (+) Transcript_17293:605-1213(+)